MNSAIPETARLAGPISGHEGLTPLAETTATSDPQAAYQRLRQQWGLVAPVQLEPGVNAWLVMGYDEICQVVKKERLFSHDPRHWRDFAAGRVPPDSTLGPMMFPREHAYFKDGDTHRRLREPIDESLRGLRLRNVSRDNRRLCAGLQLRDLNDVWPMKSSPGRGLRAASRSHERHVLGQNGCRGSADPISSGESLG